MEIIYHMHSDFPWIAWLIAAVVHIFSQWMDKLDPAPLGFLRGALEFRDSGVLEAKNIGAKL